MQLFASSFLAISPAIISLIVVLTKMGMTVSDIRRMQDGECSLEEAIKERRKQITDEIAKKQNALSLLSELIEDYETDVSSYDNENGMGEDMVYSFDSEDNIECPVCQRKYRVSGWIREYPIGAYDSEEVDVDELPEEE